jgi:hypothetical protein
MPLGFICTFVFRQALVVARFCSGVVLEATIIIATSSAKVTIHQKLVVGSKSSCWFTMLKHQIQIIANIAG